MLFRGAQWCCRFQSRHVVAPLARKSLPAWPDVCVSAKKFALRAHNGSKLAFLRLLGEFFHGNAAEGAVLGVFFAPIGPAPRSCRRRGARGWLRWGFCSIRSWLEACRRRVVPLMTPFPPFRGGPAAPSAASARAPSRRTSPRRARRRSSTTTSSRRRRNMSAALDRLKQQNEPEQSQQQLGSPETMELLTSILAAVEA